MKKEYIDLFKERKWKQALDAMPVGVSKIITVENPNDLLILRVRASEFSKAGDKTVSITSLDLERKQANVIVTKKQP